MINPDSLIKLFKKNSCDFFSGVPDSILKDLSLLFDKEKKHIIATNEGSAVSIGIGNYLSSKKMPVIYMQNSGLSNALNPLISIAHKKVYSIPLILIIGWRGSPKIKDEPQHTVKGRITKDILKLLGIKYIVLKTENDIKKFDQEIKLAKKNNSIVACLIEQGTLKKTKNENKKDFYKIDKQKFIKILLENISKDTKIISSTGYNSRELIYLRKKFKLNNGKDFYMVGGMGHTSSVALGYSLSSKKKVICIDGDGSFLMHLGSIKTAGTSAKNNFKYILLNNNCHDSVGSQCTNINKINLKQFSKSLGFKNFLSLHKTKDINNYIKKFLSSKNISFLEVKIENNKTNKLPRPENLIKIKDKFML